MQVQAKGGSKHTHTHRICDEFAGIKHAMRAHRITCNRLRTWTAERREDRGTKEQGGRDAKGKWEGRGMKILSNVGSKTDIAKPERCMCLAQMTFVTFITANRCAPTRIFTEVPFWLCSRWDKKLEGEECMGGA